MKQIYSNELKKELKKSKVVVLDIFTETCGPCKMLSPILEDLDSKYEKVNFVKINANFKANEEFILEHKISSVPTLMFYKKSKLVKRTTGFISPDSITEILSGLV